MFKRRDITLISDPYCSVAVENIEHSDFQYYDKDGFELNLAERKFYAASKFPLIDCLNHICWQEPWFELESNNSGLILDHCMFLCRAEYSGEARSQIEKLGKDIPQAKYLLNTKHKWGFDFALDAVRDNEPFEVLHIEYDNLDYDAFCARLLLVGYLIRHIDWNDAANRVWAKRDDWQHLVGFEQNNWKAKYLVGWNKAEYTEKSVKEL